MRPLLLLALLGCASADPLRMEGAPAQEKKKLRIVVFGAHPDDPESGAGGLMALLSRNGHEVIAAYATSFRADRKIGGEPEAVVRRREATEACRILGATPKFFDYAHEKLVADAETVRAVSAWLDEVKPDIVVTHWPMDTHPNHHVTSSLVWQSYRHKGGWTLYFFEVMSNIQSLNFLPDLYVDLAAVKDQKRKALDAHASQKPDEIWKIHEEMHHTRGAHCGVADAEAYALVELKEGCSILPVPFLCAKPR
jgi:LmbE family N-acetylglucosaminyl deacetylase